MILTIYYEPSVLVELKYFKDDLAERMVTLFKPVVGMIFEAGKISKSIQQERESGFKRYMLDMIFLYSKVFKEVLEKKEEFVKLEILEEMMSIYFMKRMVEEGGQ